MRFVAAALLLCASRFAFAEISDKVWTGSDILLQGAAGGALIAAAAVTGALLKRPS